MCYYGNKMPDMSNLMQISSNFKEYIICVTLLQQAD